MPIVADAAVAVRADTKNFGSDLKAGTAKPIQSLGQRVKGALNPAALIGGGVAAVGAFVVAGLAQAVTSLMRIERIAAQTDAVIKSTGGAANVTREEIDEMAGSLESLTGVEAESITMGQNLLLTFTKIRNEAGEGNDIFTQATEILVDMSVAMGTDATTGAMQLGKALNDPVKGIAALSRVGITFTADQEAMIRSMAEANDILGAQKIILAELETQFGGSAEAFGQTTSGRIARFQHEVGTFFESIILGVADYTSEVGWGADMLAMHFGDMGDRSNALADRMGISFEDLRNRIRDRMAETGESVDSSLTFIEDEFEAAGDEIVTETGKTVRGVKAALEAGSESMQEAAKFGITDPILDEMLAAEENANKSGHQVVIEYAKGLLTPQTDVEIAIQAALQIVEDEMNRVEEFAYLSGQLVILEEARGLASAQGKTASIIAIDAAMAVIRERMGVLPGEAYTSGYGVVTEYAKGMWAGIWQISDAANAIASTISRTTRIESEPPDHNSPLFGITKWGGNIVKTYADGILNELGTLSGAAGRMAGVVVPSLDMGSMSRAMAGSAVGAGGGDTYLQLVVDGKPKTVSTAQEMWSGFEQLSRFGEPGR